MNERSTGPRNSDRSEGWISMSGQDGREINARPQERTGRQYRPQVSFVAANEVGIKIGGLVKAVCRGLRTVSLQLSDGSFRQLP